MPRSHPLFSNYDVVISPTVGLCRITAESSLLDTDEAGEALRKEYRKIENQLMKRFDEGDRLDFLKEGSEYHKPEQWMIALSENERELSMLWLAEKHSLPKDIERISLRAVCNSSAYGRLTVTYEFSNWPTYLVEKEERDTSVF